MVFRYGRPIRLFQRIKHHWKLCDTSRFPFDQISNIKFNLIIQRNRERYGSAVFEKSSSNKKESNSYSKYCGGTAFHRELYTFKLVYFVLVRFCTPDSFFLLSSSNDSLKLLSFHGNRGDRWWNFAKRSSIRGSKERETTLMTEKEELLRMEWD